MKTSQNLMLLLVISGYSTNTMHVVTPHANRAHIINSINQSRLTKKFVHTFDTNLCKQTEKLTQQIKTLQLKNAAVILGTVITASATGNGLLLLPLFPHATCIAALSAIKHTLQEPLQEKPHADIKQCIMHSEKRLKKLQMSETVALVGAVPSLPLFAIPVGLTIFFWHLHFNEKSNVRIGLLFDAFMLAATGAAAFHNPIGCVETVPVIASIIMACTNATFLLEDTTLLHDKQALCKKNIEFLKRKQEHATTIF